MYGALLKFGWKRQIQYRAGMALRLAGDMLRLYVKGCIWLALLRDDFRETAAYTLASLMLFNTYGYKNQRGTGGQGKERDDCGGSDPPCFFKMVLFL